MPGLVNPSLRMSQRDVVDTEFMPDWMYYYPDFIHKGPLKIDIQNEIEQLDSVGSLKSAVATWKASQGFNSSDRPKFLIDPAVFDSGARARRNANDASVVRQIWMDDYYDRDDF